MHGLSLVNRDSRTTSVSLPEPGLPAEFRSTLHSPSASSLPDRDRYFKAAFRSPAMTTRFRAPIPRSTFLAYLFDIHRTFTWIRSSPMLWNAPPASTPLQGFLCPSGSKRLPV